MSQHSTGERDTPVERLEPEDLLLHLQGCLGQHGNEVVPGTAGQYALIEGCQTMAEGQPYPGKRGEVFMVISLSNGQRFMIEAKELAAE